MVCQEEPQGYTHHNHDSKYRRLRKELKEKILKHNPPIRFNRIPSKLIKECNTEQVLLSNLCLKQATHTVDSIPTHSHMDSQKQQKVPIIIFPNRIVHPPTEVIKPWNIGMILESIILAACESRYIPGRTGPTGRVHELIVREMVVSLDRGVSNNTGIGRVGPVPRRDAREKDHNADGLVIVREVGLCVDPGIDVSENDTPRSKDHSAVGQDHDAIYKEFDDGRHSGTHNAFESRPYLLRQCLGQVIGGG